ncbi:Tf2-6, partial [Mucuna pruriens]
MALGQLKFLLVAIDYFTKWVEAEPVATITAEKVKRFFWKKIICRYGLPAEIVSDNGTQFASRVTTNFCKELQIRKSFTSVEHPQSNGQAEAANKAEELPQVLSSYHTTPHSTTNEIPFRLTFGTEAVISVEIGESSPRTTLFEPGENEEELRANLDMLQVVHEVAHVREYAVKTRVAGRYNRRTIPRKFHPQDLILRKVTRTTNSNKLTLNWEGPFRVVEEVGRGAY